MSRLAQLLKENPIVVSGVGVVSVAGDGVPKLWDKAASGETGAVELSFDGQGGKRTFIGCPAPQVAPKAAGFRLSRRLDRSAQLALAAAQEAWNDAGLSAQGVATRRIGVVAATSRGPVGLWSDCLSRPAAGERRPSLAAATAIASLSGALSLYFSLRGPCLTTSATCASSAAAIVVGAQQLLTGTAEVMLVGGAEAPLIPGVLGQFQAAGVLGRHAVAGQTCRPFDETRNGTVIGEGAGFLVIETLASARRREVPVHAILAGWDLGAEAGSRAGMDDTGEALATAIATALAVAELGPRDIGYVNAHGTGTRLNDLAEARAIERVFGPAGTAPWCSSTKPVTGHCLGATAVIESIIAVEALRRGIAPPSGNCQRIDPQCRIRLARQAVPFDATLGVMSPSAGFWGSQAVLIFRPPPPAIAACE